MKRSQLESELIKEFTKSLNPSSRWYKIDIEDFTANIKAWDNNRCMQSLSNMKAMNNPDSKFNRDVDKEIEKMEHAGLFNIGNMKPENCLD